MKAQLEIISACQSKSFHFKTDENIWPTWHFHPEYDILLTLKNNGQFMVGDYMGTLKPGTIVMTGPNIPHAFHASEEDENNPENPAMIVLQFSKESMSSQLFERPEMNQISKFLDDADRSLEFIGHTRDQIDQLLHDMQNLSEAQRYSKIIEMLDLMANSPLNDRKKLASLTFAPSLNQQNIDKVDLVTQYILTHLQEPFSLEQMATLIHMSPKSFSRFFKKNTGKTFVNYVNELRIEKACRLLLESDDSISNICFEVGFNTLSNFNRRFLEIKGLSPRDYRLNLKQQSHL